MGAPVNSAVVGSAGDDSTRVVSVYPDRQPVKPTTTVPGCSPYKPDKGIRAYCKIPVWTTRAGHVTPGNKRCQVCVGAVIQSEDPLGGENRVENRLGFPAPGSFNRIPETRNGNAGENPNDDDNNQQFQQSKTGEDLLWDAKTIFSHGQ